MAINTQSILCTCIRLCLVLRVVSQDPFDRQDVIGRYHMTNEGQCHKLCWYRQHCASYSFYAKSTTSSNITDYNCVMHTDIDLLETFPTVGSTSTTGWVEKPASVKRIRNGCNARPCAYNEVCVPTSSKIALTSPATFHACLTLPSRCGAPKEVSHGKVNVLGMSGDDGARVTCDKGHVTSPRGVSVDLDCSVKSKWTRFAGACRQYKFKFNETLQRKYTLPWVLEDNSELCIRGNFSENGRFRISVLASSSDLSELRLLFRYRHLNQADGVYLSTKDNGTRSRMTRLADMPLAPGDNFSITVRLLSDLVQFVLNVTHVYEVQPSSLLHEDGSQFRFNGTRHIRVWGEAIVTYVNLIAGC